MLDGQKKQDLLKQEVERMMGRQLKITSLRLRTTCL